jgi:hypothetical protein
MIENKILYRIVPLLADFTTKWSQNRKPEKVKTLKNQKVVIHRFFQKTNTIETRLVNDDTSK